MKQNRTSRAKTWGAKEEEGPEGLDTEEVHSLVQWVRGLDYERYIGHLESEGRVNSLAHSI